MNTTDPPDSPHLAITVDDEQSVPVDDDWIRAAAARALSACGVPPDAHLAITFVEPAQMAELKQQALGYHEETDVLAYPMDAIEAAPGPFVLGDIVICPQVAARQAEAAGHPFEQELAVLLVHGVLHLLGHDHAEPEAEKAMFAEQARIVGSIIREPIT